MNIPIPVQDKATAHGLSTIVTGGGFDFVWFEVSPDGPAFVIENCTTGESPQRLSERANILYFMDSDWQEPAWVVCESCGRAIEAVADPDFRVAMAWSMVDRVPESDVEEYIALLDFSPSAKLKMLRDNLTYNELSESIMAGYGVSVLHRLDQKQFESGPTP